MLDLHSYKDRYGKIRKNTPQAKRRIPDGGNNNMA